MAVLDIMGVDGYELLKICNQQRVAGVMLTAYAVTPEDIKAIAMDVLRHRVIITYEAEAEELTSEDIVQRILDSIEVP